MKYRWLAGCVAALLLVPLTSCTLETPPTAQINRETALALTPTATNTPQPTATVAPTSTVAPTPTSAPDETPTSVPETETAQALVDASYCRRTFGPENATRFSGQLNGVQTGTTDEYEQIIFSFSDVNGALHGTAGCSYADAWPTDTDLGAAAVSSDAFIGLELDDWAHDDLFLASPLTATIEISGTDADLAERVSFAADSLDSRGALLGVELREPRPFRVRVQDHDLIVEIARNVTFPPENDPLGQAEGDAPEVAHPVFFLQGGDVFRWQDGQAQPVVETPEQEIGVAVSPDGTTLAVCRAPADSEPFALPYDVRATLWTMRADGSEQQLLADVGGCADPSFADSGRTIAFTANIASSPPAVLQVWTVPVVGGNATPVTAGIDEWSRFQPRWLADGRLLYRARNDGGQNVIVMREQDGTEREVTAQLLTGGEYRGVGAFVVNADSGEIAVEALRVSDDGADLVVLRDDGTQAAAEKRGFWQRPIGYAGDDLIYLSADCPAATVLDYTLQRRTVRGAIEPIVSGSTAADIGSAIVQDDVVLYVRAESAAAGLRGPLNAAATATSSSIWAVSNDGAARAELWDADAAITSLSDAE